MRVYPIFNLFLVEFCACFALSVEAKRFQDYGQHVADPRSGHSNFAADDTADQPAQAGQRLNDRGRGMSTSTDDVHEERVGGLTLKGFKNLFRQGESSSTSEKLSQLVTNIQRLDEPIDKLELSNENLQYNKHDAWVSQGFTPTDAFTKIVGDIFPLLDKDVWKDGKGTFVEWMNFCNLYLSRNSLVTGEEVMKMLDFENNSAMQFVYAALFIKAAPDSTAATEFANTMLKSIFEQWKTEDINVLDLARSSNSKDGRLVENMYKTFLKNQES